MFRASRCAAAVVLSSLLFGCSVVNRERIPDAPRPDDQIGTVDFAPILSIPSRSFRLLPTRRIDPDLMSRVLVSPNLVFESSRSSLEEPPTVGPTPDVEQTPPTKAFAVGEPVEVRLSTQLITFLAANGSTVIAPAVTRRWSWEWWCSEAYCPKTTWMERLLMMHVRPPTQPKASEAAPGAPTAADLPTVGLAVRRFVASWASIPLVVTGDRTRLVVAPRQSREQASLCGDLSVNLPIVTFSAEILDLRNGAILARFDEARYPAAQGDVTRTIKTVEYAETRRSEYGQLQQRLSLSAPNLVEETPIEASSYSYVASWEERAVACENVRLALESVMKTAAVELDTNALASKILSETLGRLYRE